MVGCPYRRLRRAGHCLDRPVRRGDGRAFRAQWPHVPLVPPEARPGPGQRRLAHTALPRPQPGEVAEVACCLGRGAVCGPHVPDKGSRCSGVPRTPRDGALPGRPVNHRPRRSRALMEAPWRMRPMSSPLERGPLEARRCTRPLPSVTLRCRRGRLQGRPNHLSHGRRALPIHDPLVTCREDIVPVGLAVCGGRVGSFESQILPEGHAAAVGVKRTHIPLWADSARYGRQLMPRRPGGLRLRCGQVPMRVCHARWRWVDKRWSR